MKDLVEKGLNKSFLRSAYANQLIGHRIEFVEEISSTNDLALQWGEQNESEGAIVFAQSQTAGRGQFGRAWHSQPGCGILCSVLLRPSISPKNASCLTPFAAVALGLALHESIGICPAIKPPNDLYYAGGKVAGILTEARTGAQFFAVVGIGINVNQIDFPPELQGRATSLQNEIGHICDKTWLAFNLLREMNRFYSILLTKAHEIQALYDKWPKANIMAKSV